MTRFYRILPLIFVFSITNARAEKWANQFTEFELPPNWSCSIEDAEWVCQSADPGKKKEAIIVLAAKLKGDQDSLDQYLTYLKGVKTFTSVTGKPMKSEPKSAKTVNINGQAWVDALHLESEIPGFYTRYLATVKDDIGVLVTYSIAKNKYSEYLGEFENLVRTLKVFRKPGGINAGGDTGLVQGGVKIPTSITTDTFVAGGNVPATDTHPAQPPRKASGIDDTTFYILVGAAAVGLMIFMKKKRGG